MSARDDYLADVDDNGFAFMSEATYSLMCADIDRLRGEVERLRPLVCTGASDCPAPAHILGCYAGPPDWQAEVERLRPLAAIGQRAICEHDETEPLPRVDRCNSMGDWRCRSCGYDTTVGDWVPSLAAGAAVSGEPTVGWQWEVKANRGDKSYALIGELRPDGSFYAPPAAVAAIRAAVSGETP